VWGGRSGTKRFMGKTNYKRRKFATVCAVRCKEMSNIVLNNVKLGTERRQVISLKIRPLRRRGNNPRNPLCKRMAL
jgi:hypothetical protein